MSKIKDIAISISSGLTPSRENLNYWLAKEVKWLKTEQIGEFEIYNTTEYISKRALDETTLKLYPINTISIAMYGEGKTRGKVSILKEEMTTNQACCNIIVNEKKADYKYIYYFIKSHYKTLRALSSGVRKNLNTDIIKNFPFNNIELKLQKKISSILYSLDKKIELNNKINLELEAMAKTIYDYWFLQFEFPNEEGKPYKSSGGKMVWNEEVKREIPEGWEVRKLEDYCNIFTGRKDVNQALEKGKYKFYSCSPNYKFSNDKLYEGKAILIAGNGSYTGRTIFVNEAIDLYQRTYACVSKNTLEYMEYLYYTLLKFFVPIVSGGTHGSAIPYIVLNDIAKQKILINKSIVEKFQDILVPIQNKIFKLKLENEELTSLRDFLLPLLMNGQVGFKGE